MNGTREKGKREMKEIRPHSHKQNKRIHTKRRTKGRKAKQKESE